MKKGSNKRPFPRSTFLKDSEKQIILDQLSQGFSITEAIRFVERDFCTYKNTRWNDPEWADSITQLLNSQVEQALLDLSKGKPAKVVLEKRTQKRGANGQIVRDANGDPVLELSSTVEAAVRQDHQAIKLWLETHASDVYGGGSQSGAASPEANPEELRAKLLKDALERIDEQ